MNGLVILPDNFTYPSGLGTSIKTGGYTAGEWVKMENNGAVFMPSCGHRQGTGYTHGGFRYQLANNNSDTYSACAYNYNNQWSSQDYKSVGHSVRLVKVYTGQ